MSSAEEGCFLTFTQGKNVISMAKVKSVEYQIMKAFYDILNVSSNNATNSHSLGLLLPEFMKQVKAMARNLTLPHPLTFYYDLFASAHQLIFSRVNAKNSNKDFRIMLNTDFPKFCGFVLEAHAEKHQDKKYVGKINFDSKLQ